MNTAARHGRKLATECHLLLASVVLLVGATSAAQQKPSYQVIAPDIVPQGEEFTIRVVENTEAGQVPIRSGNEVVINGTVLPTQERGKVQVPAFGNVEGRQFLEVSVRQAGKGTGKMETINAVPQQLDVVRLSQQGGQLPSKLWRISELSASGGDIRVDGQALGSLRNASLRGASGTYPLSDAVGSSLQVIYTCPQDLPKGSYRFVAQDAFGQRVEAPNTTKNPTLSVTGTQIRRRGQRGRFVVTSDVEGDVLLSGGEPQIQLDARTVHVTPAKPGAVQFTALQVGDYRVQALLLSPEAPPANAPRADADVGKPQIQFNPSDGKTSVTAPITITGEQGQPIANAAVDVALVEPQGVQYSRLTTDKNGRANFVASLNGRVSADSLAVHCFRILGRR